MVRLKKLLLTALALTGASLLLSGCTTKTEQDSSIPWSRPASWEGGIPGMGGMGSPGGGMR
ncbi:hypothetical protein [Rariglobus hedericola]|uniref:Lipoprotein n=1 Tax=Rariglobus hedericola TaxID=2597822 RepID=A0A556QMQ5_9BACT|nr:hypothetical protein [Rariglobus hedericola]TSJ77914.1 hypothetical protein FPL22_00975 [Rariglobus hedericola]